MSRCEQARQAREAAARAEGTLGQRQRLPKSRRHLAAEAVVARLHRRVADLRAEFQHTLSRRLVQAYRAIGVEDLAAANMVRNRRLSRAISDAGWASFVAMLDYKAEETGCAIVRAGRWFPSSQTCSACGTRNRLVKDLGVRRWACPACGVIHERDGNAAANLVPTGTQIAAAHAARAIEQEKRAVRRVGQRDRVRKAQVTKLAKRQAAEVAWIEKHEARLARHASRKSSPVAGTPSETRNARRGPVRPKPTLVGAVARTATPLRREEARTAAAGLPISVIDSGISLGASGSPVPHRTG